MDTTTMLFRSSSIGGLATQKWPSDTADQIIIENIIFNAKGLVNDRENKFTIKGTKNEHQGIQMLSNYLQLPLEKNHTRMADKFTTGECDIDVQDADTIYDIKCSYDWTTFTKVAIKELDKGYEWQIKDYQRLYGRNHGAIAYVLTNTPDEDIRHQIYMESFKWGGDEEMPDYRKIRIIRNHVYDFETFDRLVQEICPTIDKAGSDELMLFQEWELEQRICIKDCNIDAEFAGNVEKIVTRARQRAEELRIILKM